MSEPIARIEPLVNTIKQLSIGEFLKTRDFKRYCIKANLDQHWKFTYNKVRDSRTFISAGMDHEMFDSIDTLTEIFNQLYLENRNQFFLFVHDFIIQYFVWSRESINTKEIIEDLEIIGCSQDIINNLKFIDSSENKPVPNSQIPKNIWNSEKLEQAISNMAESIKNENYNLTLTYAYSSLEGMFKAFIENKIPSKVGESDLSKLSKIVKDYIKNDFHSNNSKYPEQMLNLIGTITNAVSNARNSFSESHFDNDAEKWLAEFAMDCVNSIGRLILKFVK